jgi:hypothetical protein
MMTTLAPPPPTQRRLEVPEPPLIRPLPSPLAEPAPPPVTEPARRRPGPMQIVAVVAALLGIGLLTFGAFQLVNAAGIRADASEVRADLAAVQADTAELEDARGAVEADLAPAIAALERERNALLAESERLTQELGQVRDDLLVEASAIGAQADERQALVGQLDAQLDELMYAIDVEVDAWNAWMDSAVACTDGRYLNEVAGCFSTAEADAHAAALAACGQELDDTNALLLQLEEALDDQ